MLNLESSSGLDAECWFSLLVTLKLESFRVFIVEHQFVSLSALLIVSLVSFSVERTLLLIRKQVLSYV